MRWVPTTLVTPESVLTTTKGMPPKNADATMPTPRAATPAAVGTRDSSYAHTDTCESRAIESRAPSDCSSDGALVVTTL